MKPKMIEIAGKLYNGPKLAKTVGAVPWSVVYMRLNRGWLPYEAFHTPKHIAGAKPDDDATKAAWHDAERIRHEAAAQHHRVRRDAALRRIDDAENRLIRHVANAQQEPI